MRTTRPPRCLTRLFGKESEYKLLIINIMALTVKKNIDNLGTIFSSVNQVFFKAGELKSGDLATALTVDLELPIIEDSISFNTGEPDVTQIKLISGKIWSQKTKRGDSDISLNVASIDGSVNDLLLNKQNGTTEIEAGEGVLSESTEDATVKYAGNAYDLDPKVVLGSLIFKSEDKSTIIVLPYAHIVSSFNASDGDNPAYFKLVVTPRPNSQGYEILILKKK